jgi:glyoxylase-like metal-dependent hydrolase (beta-lactamase superfamily II)
MSAPVMLGMKLPDVDVWSERVVVALGQNPGVFTGPGTNTYLIGTGPRRILLDTGEGRPEYLDVLERACASAGITGLQEIVLTHGHPDHMGGVRGVLDRFGPLRVSKLGWPGNDEKYELELTPIGDGARIATPGATLRAVHAPGHAQDHLCFMLEEEGSLFSGDNVLGVGTTVIPAHGGDLLDYLGSLERLLEESPGAIYPAHGPRIADGRSKILEYLAHRREREAQILGALGQGLTRIPEMVRRIYAGYPESLYAAAGMSVASHLRKLEREGRVARTGADLLAASWSLI